MPIHLALIALLHLPTPWSHPASHPDRSRIGAWTLRVHTDRFTGRLMCHLSQRHIDYQRQALVFHLSSRIDTVGAVYRIDGGAPIWVSSDEMELARHGFAIHDDDLANPSGGLVRIPESRLLSAHTVAIQVRANGRPIKFKIDGFAAALDASHKAACTADDFS